MFWGRWKSPNRKNVYLSRYVEEPLNSKVIKSFVPELRSRKCFWCFRILMFYIYIYIYIYEHSMYVTRSHIMIMVHKELGAVSLKIKINKSALSAKLVMVKGRFK